VGLTITSKTSDVSMHPFTDFIVAKYLPALFTVIVLVESPVFHLTDPVEYAYKLIFDPEQRSEGFV
jgi:hypothetical protein